MKIDIENIIRRYIRAKDDNNPQLMNRVFSEQATLEMEVNTGAIDFPSVTQGRDEITKTLVRDFNKTYENIYTFCLSDSVIEKQNSLDCRWFVAMSEKATGDVRVGYGDYQWRFCNDDLCLVDKLTIVIEDMIVFSNTEEGELMSWASGLPYPWVRSSELSTCTPEIIPLSKILPVIT
ncbi:nuclear transport factor 2 family protein [Pseudoteredinibacter isoporae]|uniref:SnoaL-like domain-containing protein n=1 Tax=Pseudoteredinibacter isoporae TaxID=570281 RepID=A0A7X0JRV5_9GAMM|nr:nuclear transport factor 2 family protein [Pseudoteredinibacter isoporae]MBB6520251.1 hypothetical protein [Pseudoteredinibacter isoporae]NHO85823.1 SnoaL-like domain-containing protein [Pseudoteredinibacter isoporae]NIB25725.1 SnoaL-like domain-containing protein [Pseudoteredinibacter isoporae]